MKKGQIALNRDKSLEKNKLFLRELFTTERLEKAEKFFTRSSEEHVRKVGDINMTLENYLLIIDNDFHIRLQIGDPYPEDEIRFGVKGSDRDNVIRLAWMICPLNNKNYSEISEIYFRIYHESLDEAKRL